MKHATRAASALLFVGAVLGFAQVPAQVRITHMFTPDYPAAARAAGVQGKVTLDVVVHADGTVMSVRATDGPEPLRAPAADSLKGWTFACDQCPRGEIFRHTVVVSYELESGPAGTPIQLLATGAGGYVRVVGHPASGPSEPTPAPTQAADRPPHPVPTSASPAVVPAAAVSVTTTRSAPSTARTLVRWSPSSPDSSVRTVGKRSIVAVTYAGITVEVSASELWKHYTMAEINISNHRPELVQVAPAEVTVEASGKTIKAMDPEALAHVLQNQGNLEADTRMEPSIFDSPGLKAGMAENERRADMYQAQNQADYVRDNALVTQPVATGLSAKGSVYFPAVKKTHEAVLRVPVADLIFEFPLAGPR